MRMGEILSNLPFSILSSLKFSRFILETAVPLVIRNLRCQKLFGFVVLSFENSKKNSRINADSLKRNSGVEKKVFSSKMCVLNENKNDHIILIKISILD